MHSTMIVPVKRSRRSRSGPPFALNTARMPAARSRNDLRRIMRAFDTRTADLCEWRAPTSISVTPMKTIVCVASIVAFSTLGRAAETSAYQMESKATSEVFTSRITKVYSARDGERRFFAYVIVWQDQEVIVTPYSARHDDLAVGDTVRCEMRQTHPPTIGGSKGRMTFLLLGKPGDSLPVGMVQSNPEEQARLEGVAAEVARRRAERESSPLPQTPRKATERTPETVTPGVSPIRPK
jgi:hypothetical protein